MWVFVQLLIGRAEFLAGVHCKVYVLVLIGNVEACDASLTATEDRVHDVVLVWIPAVLHPAEQGEKLSFIDDPIIFEIENVEKITGKIIFVVHFEIWTKEHKVFHFALAIAVDVEESESLLWRTEVDSESLNDRFKQYFQGIRRVAWKTVHI